MNPSLISNSTAPVNTSCEQGKNKLPAEDKTFLRHNVLYIYYLVCNEQKNHHRLSLQRVRYEWLSWSVGWVAKFLRLPAAYSSTHGSKPYIFQKS
jgi:hypothetical protein